jgi:hypothetical protein
LARCGESYGFSDLEIDMVFLDLNRFGLGIGEEIKTKFSGPWHKNGS